MLHLSSAQNTHIKRIKALQEKSRKRKLENAFCVEGEKEIRHAIDAGYAFEAFYFHEEWVGDFSDFYNHANQPILVTATLFSQLCYRKKTSKVIGIAKSKPHGLTQLNLPAEKSLVLIAEAPEKPGNIGALLRTADAMGVDAMILVNPKTDLYNPNVIRSSVGCLFSVKVAIADLEETFEFLQKRDIAIFSAAFTPKAVEYTEIKYPLKTAIAVGTEDQGLTKQWLSKKSTPIIIPMHGKNDSLNVSVATGILLAEVVKQGK